MTWNHILYIAGYYTWSGLVFKCMRDGCAVLTVSLVKVNKIVFFYVTPKIFMRIVQYVMQCIMDVFIFI